MGFFLPILFGSVAGAVIGFFAGWLFVDFGWISDTPTWKAVIGGILGGFFGAVAGSISGDANRAGESGANRLLVAFISGVIFGIMGATKFSVLGRLLDTVRIPHPFESF